MQEEPLAARYLKLCQSVWTHPDNMQWIKEDTHAKLAHFFGWRVPPEKEIVIVEESRERCYLVIPPPLPKWQETDVRL